MATPNASQILVALGGGVMQKLGTVPWRKGLATRGGELAYAFTRADATTCATYIDYDGVIRLAAANLLRIEWVDLDGDGVRESPGLFLEGSRTNSYLRSEEFDNAAWVKTSATITANAALAPDGTTAGDTFVESNDGAPAAHFFQQTLPALTDNTNQCTSIHVR